MKNYFIGILLFVSITNYTIGNDSIYTWNKKYYYDIVSVNRIANNCCIESCLQSDVCFKNDTIFLQQTYFDMNFNMQQEREVFIRSSNDLYSVQPNNERRLFLSIATHDAIVYFRDPYFETTNSVYGRIHWYLETDTILHNCDNKKRIRHKFLVKMGFPLMIDDQVPLEKSYYIDNGEAIEYHYYDENFVLLSTEYAGKYNLYYLEKRRIFPFKGKCSMN